MSEHEQHPAHEDAVPYAIAFGRDLVTELTGHGVAPHIARGSAIESVVCVLHHPGESMLCHGCADPFPCPTIRAVEPFSQPVQRMVERWRQHVAARLS